VTKQDGIARLDTETGTPDESVYNFQPEKTRKPSLVGADDAIATKYRSRDCAPRAKLRGEPPEVVFFIAYVTAGPSGWPLDFPIS
jgi:hypothetical protein